MMEPYHLLAFYNAAATQNTNNVQAPAVSDPVYNSRGNNFIIPYDLKAMFAAAIGTNLTGARVVTASLALRGYPHFDLVNRAAATFQTAYGIADWRDFPLNLRGGEDLQLQSSNNNGAATDPFFGSLAICLQQPQFPNPPAGARWIRATMTQTLTVGTWAGLSGITFEDTIEGGGYDIWGLQAICPAGVFCRLGLQGFFHRPGVPVRSTAGIIDPNAFHGYLGYMGSFFQYSPPQAEILGSTAGAQTAEILLLTSKNNATIIGGQGGYMPPVLSA